MSWNRILFKGISARITQTLGICFITLISSSLSAEPVSSSQEAFFLKRIVEYWKEGDYETAKSQILGYLKKYPQSSVKDPLYVMLGDLYLQDNSYQLALEQYLLVEQEEFISKIAFNKIVCLYETKELNSLIGDAQNFLKANSGSSSEKQTVQFFLAEAMFRLGQKETDHSKKTALYKAALPHYKDLKETKYGEYSYLPLAEISQELKNYQDACSYYLLVAEKRPQEKEALYFQIATLQTHFNTKESVRTFGQVYKLRGKKAPEAAYNQLLLLFQEKKYKELLLFQEEAIRHISKENLPLVHYWIGKSLFHLEDYIEATKHLKLCLDSAILGEEQKKNLLLSLTSCAYKTKDIPLFKELLTEWRTHFPKDNELAEALLLHSQLCMKSKKQDSLTSLQEVLDNFPNHKERESILYNCAVLLYKEGQWKDSDVYFSALIDQYPNSKYTSAAWRFKINCAIEEMKMSSPETAKIKKEELISLLQNVLGPNKILTASERKDYHFHLIRALFQLERWDETLAELEEYINLYPKDSAIGEAHFLIALCYQRDPGEIPLFISHAEKALSLNPELKEKGLLHLQLYNAYLSYTEKAKLEEKNQLLNHAADHLYHCYLSGYQNIKEDNLLWLSNYYYQKIKEELKVPGIVDKHKNPVAWQMMERAVSLYEHLLAIDHYPPSFGLTEDTLFIEGEILKFADLLGWSQKESEKIDVLEALVYEQKNQPDLNWKFQRKALLDLAKAYQVTGKNEEAVSVYDFLIHSSTHSASYTSHLALLERAKLKFSLLSSAEKNENDPEWTKILNDLKDLEIKKRLYSEPMHLEAALEYVEMKTSVVPKDKRKQKALQLLQILKDNFSSVKDSSVKDYLSARGHYPEKAQIYDKYMTFVGAEILRLQGEIAQDAHDIVQAKQFLTQATNELQPLFNQSSLPSDLSERVRRSMEATKRGL